jgi:hypothetical protein
MRYTFNNQIQNPEQIVTDKVNYFADVFNYILSNLGKPSFPNLENHKSILEKIRFQLENYSTHSSKYINFYFANRYLSLKDPFIRDYYKTDWQTINSFKVAGIQQNRKKLLKAIIQLTKIFDKTLFPNALSEIIDCIISTSKLENKRIAYKIDYYTPILISEFIFSGFPKKDLQKLFDKILSTKVEIQNNKVKTDIPLPTSLLKFKYKKPEKPELFYNKINKYLKTRTLKQQFEGIYHLYKNSLKEKTFIFYLNNIKALQPINIQIGEVRFSNQIKKENINKKGIRKEYRAFFNEKGKLFVQISLKENNDIIGKEKAVREINNAINYLNGCLDKKAYLCLDDFIVKDTDQNIRHNSFLIPLHQEEYEKLSNDNVYEILKHQNNNLIKKYLELDRIYFYAVSTDFKENKLTNYWRYLESFFESEDYDSTKIINSLSEILTKNCHFQFIMDYNDLAFQILLSSYHKFPTRNNDDLNPILEIPGSELHALMYPNPYNNTILERLNKIINHPFVNQKLKWILTTSLDQQAKLANDFFQDVLFETYEQRNFIEHSGIFYEKSVEKILFSLPKIARDFRSLIVKELALKEYNSFSEIITSLIKKDYAILDFASTFKSPTN